MSNIKEIRDTEIKLFDFWYGEDENLKGFSPIEKIFYMNCHLYYFGGGPFGIDRFEMMAVEAQVKICKKTGKVYFDNIVTPHYRVDFEISYYDKILNKGFSAVVELDGHDFHEKTKAQAKKDKEKDRNLQSYGYLVARFTGSEIYNDPFDAIHKVQALIISAWKRELTR